MAYENEWETGSGFSLDGATATISDADFRFKSDIGQDGATVLNLTLSILDDDGNETEEVEQYFTVGGKFESNRDGTELEGTAKVNKNSNFGILLESVKEVFGGQGIDPGEALGNPRLTESWIGTTWEWGTIEQEVRNPSTGETLMRSKFVVTAFIDGDDAEDEAPAPKKAAAKKAPAKKAPAKKAAARGPKIPDGIDSDLWDTLVETAKNYEGEHDEFAAELIEDEDVAGNNAVMKAVMGTKAGSVWAAAGREV